MKHVSVLIRTPLAAVAMTLLAGVCQAGDLTAGRYSIAAAHSGKCVDVTASGLSDGTNIQQYSCNGGRAQAFDVSETATGEYKLIAVISGKAVDVTGASMADGANIQQWADNGTGAQRFYIRRVSGSSTDFTIVNKTSGKCVDVVGGYTTDGANVQQYTCNGNAQQRFRFNLKLAGVVMATGRYTVQAVHSGKCLDVAASGAADGTNIQQYACNGTGAQAFDLSRDAEGYYQLNNAANGKAMDVAGSGLADGANVQIWTDFNADNQRFTLVDKGNGQLELRAKHSGKCVDVAGQYTTDAANVQQWTCNNQTNQRWTFTKSSWTSGATTPPPSTGGSPTAQIKQRMLDFLVGISGKQTLVGVENKNAGTPTSDTNRVTAIAGRVSSFWGGDFGFGAGAVNNRSTMIGEAKKQFAKGALVSLMYHACAPTRDEFCSWDDIGASRAAKLSDAQFKDLLTPGTQLYNSWIGRLNILASHLQDLKSSGVVVLFRPFHEMNQCVFWWSCHKGTYGSAALYRMTHDYLAKTKGLDNIIWVWNVQDFTSLNTDVDAYTPGSNYFDMATLDVYNTGYTSNNYNTMLRIANGKLIAIAENQFVPTPDLLKQQPKWVFEMLWPDFIDDARNKATLPSLYGASQVLTLDEMPGWR